MNTLSDTDKVIQGRIRGPVEVNILSKKVDQTVKQKLTRLLAWIIAERVAAGYDKFWLEPAFSVGNEPRILLYLGLAQIIGTRLSVTKERLIISEWFCLDTLRQRNLILLTHDH